MKKLLIGAILTGTALQASAFDEKAASTLAKKYSETVACQIQTTEFQKSQYKAVRVRPDTDGLGAIFVVYWEGDTGCSGGSGTVVPNFTVIEQRGFSTVPPVVTTDYKFPELQLVQATSFSGKGGVLIIKGVTYSETDQQGNPTKSVSYTVRLDKDKFVKQ